MRPDAALRPATALDAMAVARWFRTAEEAVLWAGPGAPWPVPPLWLAREFDHPVRRHYAFTLSGRLAGVFSVVFHPAQRRAHLIHVALAPERRGQGLSRDLLQGVREVALSQGAAERLTLNVFERNAPAVAAYLRAGFRAYARAPAGREGPDAVLRMALALD